MAKINQILGSDYIGDSRADINEAMASVEVGSPKLIGDGNVGTELDIDESQLDPSAFSVDSLDRSNHYGADSFAKMATSADPAVDAAVTTAIIDVNDGVVITTTTTGNAQTLQSPTDTTAGKHFKVVNNDTSTDSITVNGVVLNIGKVMELVWDGSAWTIGNEGDVVGPAAATDGAIATFDGATGKILQDNSNVKILSGVMSIGTVEDVEENITINSSTGVVSGGNITINVDTTKYDVSAGHGHIVDTSDPENITVTHVTWTAKTGVTPTNLATELSTNIAIDVNGNIFEKTGPWTPQERRQYIVLGGVTHVNLTNIDSAFNRAYPTYSPTATVTDLSETIGFINIDGGNVFSANGANLNINKTDGNIYAIGQNAYNDSENPNIINTPSLTAPTFLRVYRDGSGGSTFASASTIDPSQWDDGSGTLQTTSVNKFTIQRFFLYPNTNTVVVAYGQKEYNSLTEAKAGIVNDEVTSVQDVTGSASFRGWIIVKEGTVSLQNTANVLFKSADMFGSTSQGGISAATTNLQQAYDNSTQPQITVDNTGGALQVKNGRSSDTDNIFEALNLAGAATAAILGNGTIKTNTLDSFSGTDLTISQNLVISGDLIVSGTTTTIDSTTLRVEDKNIEIGNVAIPTDITADGGGITLLGSTNKTITWDNANNNWTSSEHWNLLSGKEFKINNVSVLNATTLGSSIVNSSLTSVGTISSGVWGADLAADTIDAITEIASALKSGADATLITGTSGTNGNLLSWNLDGDAVDSGIASSSVALTSGNLSQFAATTSAQLAGVISDETGSGSLVFSVSPAFTGSPTAPTQAPNDNSTKLATTAYVDAAGGGGGNKTIWLHSMNGGATGTGTGVADARLSLFQCVDFNDGTDGQVINHPWTTPDDFTSITSVEFYWATPTTSANAVFEFTSAAMGAGEVYNVVATDSIAATTYTSSATSLALNVENVTAMVDGLTISAGDLITFQVKRNGANASDTLGGSAFIFGFRIVYS